MTPPPIIALTTDFGPSSPYVAQMKAVILSTLPEARLLDLTHAIAARSIRQAEVVLRGAAFTLPVGSVHLVVVDPGVGTTRRPIAVTARGLTFVGPDNGVLGVALAQPGAAVVCLDRPELFRHPVAPTFHGRDLFAPVAAELAAGLTLPDVGSPITDAVPTTLPAAVVTPTRVSGEALAADHFGNLLSNIPAQVVTGRWSWRVAGRAAQWVETYGQGEPGALLALVGSDGYVEISVRDGSAAAALGGSEGLAVEARRE